ncbi:MAG TPA: LuxR family transcriptional regulator [Beijerinckiaceae bacterium]|jgi:DNA-binding CsgD family transcriptional regulator
MREFDSAFEAALAAIETATNFDELGVAVSKLLKSYNLKHAVYHVLRMPAAEQESPLLLLTYPQEWIDRYFQKRYMKIDPVVKEGERSILPVDWSRLDRSPSPIRNFFGEAEDAGLGRHGLTFPIRGALGDSAIFSITSNADDKEWDSSKLYYLRDMQVLGNYIHAVAMRLSGVKTPDYIVRLSRRERECLQWAAVGMTISTTADRLCLSDRVVRGYLDSARHKLDCLTKSQAVAKAISLGIIRPQ